MTVGPWIFSDFTPSLNIYELQCWLTLQEKFSEVPQKLQVLHLACPQKILVLPFGLQEERKTIIFNVIGKLLILVHMVGSPMYLRYRHNDNDSCMTHLAFCAPCPFACLFLVAIPFYFPFDLVQEKGCRIAS